MRVSSSSGPCDAGIGAHIKASLHQPSFLLRTVADEAIFGLMAVQSPAIRDSDKVNVPSTIALSRSLDRPTNTTSVGAAIVATNGSCA